MHHRRRQRDRRVERPTAALLGAAALVALLVGLAAPGAGAAVEPIALSPASGAAGTHVTVSGSDCAPGLVGGSTLNHVALLSTTLHIGLTVPVSSSGTWSTSFTIPPGTPAGPVAIAPVCVSSGFSLTTVYTPATFVVTAAPPPTAPPPPPTTPTTRGTSPATRGTSSTTKAGGRGGGTSSVSTPGASGATTGGRAAGAVGGGRAANGARGSDGVISAIGTVTGDPDTGRAAGLRSPQLASDSSGSPGGLSWWWWLVLAAVVVGGIGAWLWARRRHRAAIAPPAAETADRPVDDDPEPDDWLEHTYVDDIPTATR